MDEKELNSSMRKKYEPALKTRVAIEAIKGTRTAAEIAKEFEVPSSLVSLWKKSALAMVPEAFSRKSEKTLRQWNEERDELHRQIGQLKVELDWIKKKLSPRS